MCDRLRSASGGWAGQLGQEVEHSVQCQVQRLVFVGDTVERTVSILWLCPAFQTDPSITGLLMSLSSMGGLL